MDRGYGTSATRNIEQEVQFTLVGTAKCDWCDKIPHYYILAVPPKDEPSWQLCDQHYRAHWTKVLGGTDKEYPVK